MELLSFSIIFISLLIICSGIEKATKFSTELYDGLNSIGNLPDIKSDSTEEKGGLGATPQESPKP